jgi:hypothetical protein
LLILRSGKTLAVLVLAVSVLVLVAIQIGVVSSGHTPKAETPVGIAQASYNFNVADERLLVGSADNVFVGRVVEVKDNLSTSGPSEDPPLAQSQFAVEVLENIKGQLVGTVTINQGGGYVEYHADRDYPEDGVHKGERVRQLILIDKDPLLEPGQQYMFVTAYDQKAGWHELAASVAGDIKIKDNAQRKALVERFKEAKRDQVDPSATGGS